MYQIKLTGLSKLLQSNKGVKYHRWNTASILQQKQATFINLTILLHLIFNSLSELFTITGLEFL